MRAGWNPLVFVPGQAPINWTSPASPLNLFPLSESSRPIRLPLHPFAVPQARPIGC
jgi:hypothetical protein